MEALITSTPGVLCVYCCLIAFAIWGAKKPFLRKFGPAMVCIIGSLILSNIRLLPKSHEVYDFIGSHLVNMAIAVLLLNTDIKKIRQFSSQSFGAMLIACAVVCIMTLFGGIIFAPSIGRDVWKLAGMFVGTYVGGSANLNMIASALETSPKLLTVAHTADMVFYTPFIILIMWAGSSLGSITRWNKFWPFSVSDSDLKMEGGSDYLSIKEWSILDIAVMVTLGFGIVGVSTWLGNLLISLNTAALAAFRATFRVIFIATISVILAQFKIIKDLRGKIDLGIYLTLFYLVSVGVQIDLIAFANASVYIAIFCFIVVFGSLLIHLLLCRVFNIKWQYVLVSIQAAVGSPISAAALSAASGWETLVGVGIVLGVFGNAVGNYLGLAIAYGLKAMLGIG